MKNRAFLFLALLSLVIFSACAPTQQTDTGVTIESKVDPNVYTIDLQMESEEGYTVGHASVSGSNYGGYGFVSGRYWEDGKGVLRGVLSSVDSELSFAEVGDTIIIKTTDRKVMALIPGDTVTFACTVDYEPVCAKSEDSSSSTGECVDTWEFDFCRILEIKPAE